MRHWTLILMAGGWRFRASIRGGERRWRERVAEIQSTSLALDPARLY